MDEANGSRQFRAAQIANGFPAFPTDLRDVRIDPAKPIDERVKDFLEQVGDPSFFRVGEIRIKVNYGTGKTFTDALTDLFRAG